MMCCLLYCEKGNHYNLWNSILVTTAQNWIIPRLWLDTSWHQSIYGNSQNLYFYCTFCKCGPSNCNCCPMCDLHVRLFNNIPSYQLSKGWETPVLENRFKPGFLSTWGSASLGDSRFQEVGHKTRHECGLEDWSHLCWGLFKDKQQICWGSATAEKNWFCQVKECGIVVICVSLWTEMMKRKTC